MEDRVAVQLVEHEGRRVALIRKYRRDKPRRVAVVSLKYNPKQPRDPGGEHGGQWVKEPGGGVPDMPEILGNISQEERIDRLFLDPYHTSPEKRASPRFKPLPKPTSTDEARAKEPGGHAEALLAPQIQTYLSALNVGESHRFPEGTLVEAQPHGDGLTFRIDGPDGTFWRLPPSEAAHLTEFEETTARANRFGKEIPGNPLVPLPGVDTPPQDPIGDAVGGTLHGGFTQLPRGTVVHRRIGEKGDFFDLTSPTGTKRSFPATEKGKVVKAAREMERKAEGRLGGGGKPRKQTRTTSVKQKNGPLRPLPLSFQPTRIALHAESERVLGYEHGGNEIALVRTPGGFGTPEYTDKDGKRTRLRVDGTDTVLEKDGEEIVRDSLGPAVDPPSAKQLADFFELADKVLRDVRKQAADPGDTVGDRFDAPIIWPEHFDMAFDLGRGDEAHPEHRAGFGASPGDERHPEPYFYVNPWSPQESSDTWNADGFNGAELSYAEVLASSNQEKTIRDFYLSRMRALGAGKADESVARASTEDLQAILDNPDSDPALRAAARRELASRKALKDWRMQPRDPGGEHGGQWVRGGSAPAGGKKPFDWFRDNPTEGPPWSRWGQGQGLDLEMLRAADPVTPAEAQHLYQNGWNEPVNLALRGLPPGQPTGDFTPEEIKKTMPRLIKGLDRDIANGGPTMSHVYRGVDLDAAPGLAAHMHKGAVFTDGGFLSTSGNEVVASNFAYSRAHHGIVMDLKVPKGTKSLQIEGSQTEAEHLLPRGGTFKVVSDPYPVNYLGVKFDAIDVEWSPPQSLKDYLARKPISEMDANELAALQARLDAAPDNRVTQALREKVNVAIENLYGEGAAPR